MVNAWWVQILVGCMLGFLSGLGVGGGSLLMLWLTQMADVSQADARILNLMFFGPCALIASLFRLKQAKPNWGMTLTAVAGGLAGALLGNFLNSRMELALARKLLGGLFLVCGARELCYRDKKAR